MRLKQLRLSGFKSFCDDTVLHFTQKGISVIVGPNGCGKSNVVDAIRWALGEQSPRFLRGGAMSDVIFGGSASRKPVGRAEVTILFDNTEGLALEKYNEYSEISVTRRLYRSGESEYLINNSPARLLDIRELVMDTGAAGRSYSIVEQGKVDQFITTTPQERRIFLEEAAGIVRYKTKRIQAEKRIDSTRQNLLRVADVLGELVQREEALRDQVGKAREYLALRERVAEMGGLLNRARYIRSAKKFRASAEVHAKAAQAAEDLGVAYQTRLTELEALEGELSLMEHQVQARREELHTKEREISAAETKLALSRQEKENIQQWIERLEENLQTHQAQRLRLEEELQEHQEALAQLEKEEQTHREEIRQMEQGYQERESIRAAIEAQANRLSEQLVECHAQTTGLANQERFLLQRETEDSRRLEGMSGQLAQMRTEVEQSAQALEANREQSQQGAAALEAGRARQEQLAQLAASRAEEAQGLAQGLREAQRETMECASRLETLKEINAGYEGFGDAVRAFLQWVDDSQERRQQVGLVGPLADFLKVEPEVLGWAGPFLAPYLELIVVREGAAIPRIEGLMEAEGMGRVRLVALDAAPEARVGGLEGTFAQLVALPPEMEPLKGRLFGNIRLLPGGVSAHPLPEGLAKALSNGNATEWLAGDGRFHLDQKAVVALGKSTPPSVGVLQRRQQIEALEARLQQLAARQSQAEEQLAAKEEEARLLKEQMHQGEEECRGLELERKRLDQEAQGLERELGRLRQALARLEDEEGQIKTQLDQSAQQRQAIQRQVADWASKKGQLEEELATARTREAEAREEAGRAGEQMTERKVAHSRAMASLENSQNRMAAVRQEVMGLEERRQEAEETLNHRRRMLEETSRQMEALSQDISQAALALEEQRKLVAQLNQDFQEREEKKLLVNGQVKEARVRQEEAANRLSKLEVSLAEERMRMEQYTEQLGEEGVPTSEEELEIDEVAVEKEWAQGRKKLEQMEGVNLAAPEEYDALTARMGELTQQKEDLETAIKNLEDSIRQMNTESRKRFKETFDQVNGMFQKVFPQVFGGGSARLVLTDSEDLLLAGVDIEAEPPGKKLSGLSLLSGGEKALTAISLIFSFFLIKPSPFCLLDEVDAPLDDANVGRYNRLVQSVMDRTQFILITHNRRTMEIGDLMYGVTMEESGVSKVVSVNLAERAAP